MRNVITRTIYYKICTCLFYIDGKVKELTVRVPNRISSINEAEKFIQKNGSGNGKLISIEKFESIGTLYGMEESVFIQHATPFSERSSLTRGCITKNISILVGELLYMDADYSVKKLPVIIPKEYSNKLDSYAKTVAPPGTKRIAIENVKTQSKLYAMSESDFIKYARKMIDHQHFMD